MSISWSKELIQEIWTFLENEIEVIVWIRNSRRLTGRSKELYIMLWSLSNRASAILILSKLNDRFYAECVTLTRWFFETMVNVIFLHFCDEVEFSDCMEHTLYKQYMKWARNKKVMKDRQGCVLNEISLEQIGIEDLRDDASFSRIAEKFEWKWKRNTDFPVPKIEERLWFISKQDTKLNTSLLLLYQLTYYSDASESLHWSVYGSSFHILEAANCWRWNEATEYVNGNIAFLLEQTIGLFHQFIILLNEKNDIGDFYERSKLINESATKALYSKINK